MNERSAVAAGSHAREDESGSPSSGIRMPRVRSAAYVQQRQADQPQGHDRQADEEEGRSADLEVSLLRMMIEEVVRQVLRDEHGELALTRVSSNRRAAAAHGRPRCVGRS